MCGNLCSAAQKLIWTAPERGTYRRNSQSLARNPDVYFGSTRAPWGCVSLRTTSREPARRDPGATWRESSPTLLQSARYKLTDGARGTLRTSQSPSDSARAATIKTAFLRSALLKEPARSFAKREQWVTSVLDKAQWSTVKIRAAVAVIYHKPKVYVSWGLSSDFWVVLNVFIFLQSWQSFLRLHERLHVFRRPRWCCAFLVDPEV